MGELPLFITETEENVYARFSVEVETFAGKSPVDMVMEFNKARKVFNFSNASDFYGQNQEIPFSRIEEFRNQLQLHGYEV